MRLLELQRELQRKSYGLDPQDLRGEDLLEFIRWNTLAATAELHEALAELPWKPWKRGGEPFNRVRFVREQVDVLHFVANLLIAVGATDEELEAEFAAKQKINAERQESGY